ncbi:MAG: protein kinase [Planctomycetes bacterium]|nr:protein kinase [Planctomycetota bacterium]MCW8136575.1 protein kinase [Planctomycetota bacterium]
MYDPTKAASLLPLLPLPLAQALRRALNAKSPEGAHLGAYYFFEASLKLTAASLVAVYLQDGAKEPKLNKVIENLARPSTGHWLNLLREISNWLGGRPDAGLLPLSGVGKRLTERAPRPACTAFIRFAAKAQDKEDNRSNVSVLDLFDAIVGYRNAEVGHGGQRTQAFYSEASPLLVAAMLEGFEALNPFEGLMFCVARDVIDTRSSRTVRRYEVLRGDGIHVPFDDENREADTHIPAGQLLLVGRNVRVRLHPLLVYELDELERDRVGFLNKVGVRRGKTEQVGVKNVEYLDYDSGARLTSHNPTEELAALLTRVSGQQVSAGDIDNAGEAPDSEAGLGQAVPGGAAAEWIGDFEILGELGRGGMGIVYKARQGSLKRVVALKVLPPGVSGDPIAVARFKREISALARCDHANVIKVLAAGQDGDRYYYAMEYVEGSDLAGVYGVLTQHRDKSGEFRDRDLLKAISSAGQSRAEKHPADMGLNVPKLSKGTAVISRDKGKDYYVRLAEIVGQAAAGVAHLHSHGIIHRDLKPGNIMLTTDGSRAIIMDLGLAQMQDQSVALTMSSVKVLGTLRYMPPEQLQHQMLEIKETADIYSLGATLYELAALAPMFDGDSEARLMQQVLQEEPRSPRQVNSAVPRDLDTIIRVATSKLPNERYPTALSLQQDLEAFARGEPVKARAPGTFHYLRLFYAKNKPLVATIAAGVALLIAVVSWFIVNLNESRADALAKKAEAEHQRQEADSQREMADRQRQEAENQRRAAVTQRAEAERQAGIAEQQRQEADNQRARAEIGEQQARSAQVVAEQSEQRAMEEKARAVAAERIARERLASGAIMYGDQLLNSGRLIEARKSFEDARRIYRELGINPVPAESGLNNCNWKSPSPAVTFGATSYSPMGSIAVAPDGKRAYFSGSYGYLVWDIAEWREVRSVQRHGGVCTVLALTPDGETVITGGEGGVLKLWSAKDDSLLGELWGHDFMLATMKLAPDGRTLASLESSRLIVWDLPSRQMLFRKDYQSAGYSRIAFAPDSARVAVCAYNGAAHVYDLKGNELAHRKPAKEFEELLGAVWGADGMLYVSMYQAGIQVFDPVDLSRSRVIKVDRATAIYGASGGSSLFAATDKELLLLDTDSGATTVVTGAVTRVCTDMAYLPDAGRLIIVGGGGQPQLVDLAAGKLLHDVVGHGADVTGLAISDNGGMAATLGTDGFMCVWEIPTGRMLYRAYSITQSAIAFAPGSRRLNSYSSNGEHAVYDIVGDTFTERTLSKSPPVHNAVFSRDGSLVAGVVESNAVQVVRHDTGQVLQKFKPDRGVGQVVSMVISGDGKSVLTGYSAGLVIRFSIEDGEVQDRLIGFKSSPHRLAFGTGNTAVVGDTGGSITTWKLGTGAPQVLPAHSMRPFSGEVIALAANVRGDRLATSSYDGYLRTWEWKDGWEPASVLHAGSVTMCAAWLGNGIGVIAGTQSGRAHLFTTGASPDVATFDQYRSKNSAVTATAISPGGRMLAMGNADGGVEFWCCESGMLLAEQKVATGRILAMTFNAQGDKLFVADEKQGVRLWDPLQDKSTWKRQMGEDLEGLSMAVSPARDLLVFQHSEALILMDADTGKTVRWKDKDWQFEWSADAICFSHDGRELLYGSAAGAIRIIDLESCTIRTPLTGGPTSSLVCCAAYSPDGRWIVTGHFDGHVRVWSNATGRLHASLHCHRSRVSAIAVGGDPRFAFTVSNDGWRRMVDLERGEEIAGWQFVSRELYCIAVRPDAGLIASGGDQGTLFIELPGRVAVLEAWDARLHAVRSQMQARGPSPELVARLGEYFAFRQYDYWGAPFLRSARNAGATEFPELAFAQSSWRLARRIRSHEWAREARQSMERVEAGSETEMRCYLTLARQMLSLLENSLKSGD